MSLYLQRMTQQAHARNIHISHLRIILDDLYLYIFNQILNQLPINSTSMKLS